MTQTLLQSNQMVNQTALSRLEATSREPLDTMFSKIAQAFSEPGWISVSGGAVSGTVVEIGNTEVNVLNSGKSKSYPPVLGVDVSGVSGTYSFSTGTGTGDVQNSSVPSMTASNYVKCGFELRSDRKIYPIYGIQGASISAATQPIFGTGIPMGMVVLRDNGSGGTTNLLPITNDSIIQYTNGGSGNSASNPIVNYLASSNKEWNFESGQSTGWETYADAAATSPVDGTGGIANTTFAASNSSPLRGTFSGLLTKNSGASRQGEGVSVAFTLDAQDVGKPFTFSFDTSASANYTGSSGTEYARVYCYDVTNGALLPGYVDIAPGSSTTKGFFLATTSTSYRFIVHIAGTGTSAWTLKVDNIIIGQQSLALGQAVTDWQSYSLIIQASSSPNVGTTDFNEARWRRVGDSMEIYYFLHQTGAGANGSGNYFFPIPSGYTIDTAKISADPVGHQTVGSSTQGAAAGNVFIGDTTRLQVLTTGSAILGSSNSNLSSGNATIGFIAKVPIVGWSSNTIVGDRSTEQYASNNGTWDATDTTSFVNGLLTTKTGGPLTSDRTKRVRFQTPHSPTSKFRILFSQDGKQFFDSSDFFHTTAGALIKTYNSTGTTDLSSGVYLQFVSGSSTDVDVLFARYYSIGNDDTPAVDWPSNIYWTVERVEGGALTGYPISARNIVGDTTGTTVPTGYIGNVTRAVGSGVSVTGNSGVFTIASISLSPGNYIINAGTILTGSGHNAQVFGVATVTNSTIGWDTTNYINNGGANANANNQSFGRVSYSLTVSSTTTYYLTLGNVSSATSTGAGFIEAVRVG